jgi:hypothetical protein
MFHRLAFLSQFKISHCRLECKEEGSTNVDKTGLMTSIVDRTENNHFPAIAKEGVNMDKRIVFLYSIVALVMLSVAVLLYFSPEDRLDDTTGLIQIPTPFIVEEMDHAPRYVSAYNIIGGICALLLVGYLFWACYRKSELDSQVELNAMEDSLYKISLATGQTEYDLLHKSAEDWSVSGNRIDQDFKRYMTDQVMPYYAKDFVRKNQAHIDESLVVKKEVTPTSWSDWAIALLVFPGSILLLTFMGVCLA